MFRFEPSILGDDLRRNAMRFADQVVDRGRDAADRGRSAYNRLTSSRRDPLDEVRAVAAFAVGAAALVGVGFLITRLVKARKAQRRSSGSATRHDGRGHDRRAGASDVRDEPVHQLLARMDTPEAIRRHNEQVRQMHESNTPSRERETEQAAH